ncbi:MAG: YfcE family phosphodiesterase [Clostridia bacterium]|nr:YfcE family phosphodiesterase [Clostridia bacterium]
MTIIVFSDSHGSDHEMRRVIQKQKPYADYFLHLGDGAVSFLELCEECGVLGYAVRGNCDFFLKGRQIPDSRVLCADTVSLFLTHGDTIGVGFSTETLSLAAKEKGCKIALYGHTHIADNRYLPAQDEKDVPIYLFNPGSIARPRDIGASYGRIDISGENILLNIVRL